MDTGGQLTNAVKDSIASEMQDGVKHYFHGLVVDLKAHLVRVIDQYFTESKHIANNTLSYV